MGTLLRDVFDIITRDVKIREDDRTVSSYNSTPVSSIELAKVKKLTAQFNYNRFTHDELTNDSGDYVIRQNTRDNAIKSIDNIQQRIPRFVKLTWQSSHIERDNLLLNLKFRRFTAAEIRNAINAGRVNDIRNFNNGNFFNLVMQDTGIDNKLFTVVSASIESLKAKEQVDISAGQQNLINELKKRKTLIEHAQRLHEQLNSNAFNQFTSEGTFLPEQNAIIDEFHPVQQLVQGIIQQFGSDPRQRDYLIVDSDNQEHNKIDLSKTLRAMQFKATINNKYIYTVAKNIEQDSAGIFADEVSNFSSVFKNAEIDTITEGAQKFELSFLERSIASVENISVSNLCQVQLQQAHGGEGNANNRQDQGRGPELEAHKTILRSVGYIIEKRFVDAFGNIKIYDPVIVDEPSAATFRDRRVIYGVTYHYKISPLVEWLVPFTRRGQQKFARILIKGDSSNIIAETHESFPPRPPQDFNIFWSNHHQAPVLRWAKSLSRQRDVARYFIMKRENIDEPFKLLALIDFADENYVNRLPINKKFIIDASVDIINAKHETTQYIDKRFDPNKKQIYAIVAGDYHEIYSNYSMQLEIDFDTLNNKLWVNKISDSNTPLPYPNIYVKRSLFNKAIMTSGVKRCRLYFNPDAVTITRPNNDDPDGNTKQQVVALKNDENYKLSIINTDLNKGETIHINVDDNRINRR